MNPRHLLESMFAQPLFGPALFYGRPGGLRFELSERGGWVEQFQQAMGKAQVLCGELFPRDETLMVCLRFKLRGSVFSARPSLRALRQAGIRLSRPRSLWCEALGDEEAADDLPSARWCMLAFPSTAEALPCLLWCALCVDFPVIQPNPGCEVHLFNLTRRLHVHPYDDRGMDVVGEDHAFLAGLYQRHQPWLLAYDRALMAATFAGPGARL